MALYIVLTLVTLIIAAFWFYRKHRRKVIPRSFDDLLGIVERAKLFPLGPDHKWVLVDVCHGHRVWQRPVRMPGTGAATKSAEPGSTSTEHVSETVYGTYGKVKATPQTVLRALSDSDSFEEWRTCYNDVRQLSPVTCSQSTSSSSTNSGHSYYSGSDPGPKSSSKKSSSSSSSSAKGAGETLTSWHSDTISGQYSPLDVPSGRGALFYRIAQWLGLGQGPGPDPSGPAPGLLGVIGLRLDRITYRIDRRWCREDGGCCWYMENNPELGEWTFVLIQPVEKWFDKRHCLVTVIFHPYHLRTRSGVTIRTGSLLGGLHDHLQGYHKVQATPPGALTSRRDADVTDASTHDVSKADSKGSKVSSSESPGHNTSASARARILWEDVLSRFNKQSAANSTTAPPGGTESRDVKAPVSSTSGGATTTSTATTTPPSESRFVARFKNLIEEKREWYEERRRQAAIRASETSAKAKDEVESILDDRASLAQDVTKNTPDDNNKLTQGSQKNSPMASSASVTSVTSSVSSAPVVSPTVDKDSPRTRQLLLLHKSKTTSCLDDARDFDEFSVDDDDDADVDATDKTSADVDFGVGEDDEKSPSLSDLPSVGSKIKRRLLTEINKKLSLDSSWAVIKDPDTSTQTSSTPSQQQQQQQRPQQQKPQPQQQQQKQLQRQDQVVQPIDNSPETDTEASLRECGLVVCAELLNIKSNISNIDIKLPYDQQAARSGGWIYCGLEREVVILRKVYEEGSSFSSYLGKGLIACPPKTVFDSLRNPRTRFTYDEMLKKMDILQELSDGMKIVYWFHEVSQLFKRDFRDFCVLQFEKAEGNKYMIALRSVSWPGCPERDEAARATLFSSGWIIEPTVKNNQVHSMVTYVVQMELPPSKATNGSPVEELASKQPLSVAFLRQYLVPSPTMHRSTTPASSTSSKIRRYGSLTAEDQPGPTLQQSDLRLFGSRRGSNTSSSTLEAPLRDYHGDQREVLDEPPVRC